MHYISIGQMFSPISKHSTLESAMQGTFQTVSLYYHLWYRLVQSILLCQFKFLHTIYQLYAITGHNAGGSRPRTVSLVTKYQLTYIKLTASPSATSPSVYLCCIHAYIHCLEPSGLCLQCVLVFTATVFLIVSMSAHIL